MADLVRIDRRFRRELVGSLHIMRVNRTKQHDLHRQDDNHHPGSVGELRDRDDEQHHERRQRADSVDDDAALPTRLATPPPAHHHAGLRQRERAEHAKCVQWNQSTDTSAKGPQHERRRDPEHDDADRIREAIPPEGELAWQESVAPEEIRQPWEIRIRSIRCQKQDEERRVLHRVVKQRIAEHGVTDLRDDRFWIAARLGDAGHNANPVREVCDAAEGDGEYHHHRGECFLRIHPFGRLERWNAIRDGLDARQRCTA